MMDISRLTSHVSVHYITIYYLPLYQSFFFFKCKEDDYSPEYEGDGVGLLIQIEAVLAADVLTEVDAALGVGDPPLRLSSISPELERQAV